MTATVESPCKYPSGLASDGTHLYLADWREARIYQVDPADGSVQATWPAPSLNPHGLTFGADRLWISDDHTGGIFALDLDTGIVDTLFSAPDERAYGLAYADGELFVLARDKVYRVTTDDGTILDSFAAPARGARCLAFDGRYLWIPNAEYRRESRTMIYGADPNNLTICRSFPVDDHIGAIASDGKNLLYGVNWDAAHFYTWDFDGHQFSKVASPTSVAYQDIKYYAGKLLCSGHQEGQSVIDIIDPQTWSLVKRINLPRDRWKTNLSREGMAFDGNLYFLPDDGPDSHILIFALR